LRADEELTATGTVPAEPPVLRSKPPEIVPVIRPLRVMELAPTLTVVIDRVDCPVVVLGACTLGSAGVGKVREPPLHAASAAGKRNVTAIFNVR